MIKRYTRQAMGKIWTDQYKFQKWLEVEIAACQANAEIGLIPKDSVAAIEKKASFNVERILEIEKIVDHDVIAFTTNLAENIGEEAKYVHFGLTSSDVVDTALAMILKDACAIIFKQLEKLLSAIKKQALNHKYTAMIGRTHGIHAEPMTFGAKLLMWYTETKRNLERIEKAKKTISVGKLSGAVGIFGNIDPRVEEIVCKKLDLEPAIVATQVLQRDRHAELMSTLAIIAASLEKFAVEIRNLQRTDIAEVLEPFKSGQKGSSAMPHKRNPITAERITGLARVIRGYAITAFENVALWHERDISHSGAERVILPDAFIALDYMLEKMAYIIDNLQVNENKMLANLNKTNGVIYSGKLLLKLVEKGYSREDAYLLIQKNALKAIDTESNMLELVKNDTQINSKVSDKELTEIFDYKQYLNNIDYLFTRALKEE